MLSPGLFVLRPAVLLCCLLMFASWYRFRRNWAADEMNQQHLLIQEQDDKFDCSR